MIRIILAALLLAGLTNSLEAGMVEGQAALERGDYATAHKDLLPLAEQGDALAQGYIGQLYHHGYFVAQDYAEAEKWYRRAAEQGDADSQNSLGQMYAEGQGVPQDYDQEINWYREAAEQGHAIAQSNMGSMYFHGRGVSQDNVEAYMWLSLAAAQGDEYASNVIDNLGAQMTFWDRSKAKRRARQWMEKHGKAA